MSFDPYRHWLGITHPQRPVDHYLLLGLPWFEADPAVISAAADQRLSLLRSIQHGPQGAEVARLLQEVSTAKICLLSPAKQAYDEGLRPIVFGKPLQTAAEEGLSSEVAGLLLPPVAMVGSVVPQPGTAPPVAQRRGTPAATLETSPAFWQRPAVRWVGIAAGVVALAAVCAWVVVRSRSGSAPPMADAPEATLEPLDETPSEDPVVSSEPAPVKSRPVIIRQEGNGELQFTPATARLFGTVEFKSLGTESVIRNWTTSEDALEWDFHVVKPDVFRLEITYAAAAEWEGAKYRVTISGEAKEFVVRSSGGADRFHTDVFHFPVRRNGAHVLRINATMQPGAEVMVLKGLRLIPAKAGG